MLVRHVPALLLVAVLTGSLAGPIAAGGPATDVARQHGAVLDNQAAIRQAIQSGSPIAVIVQLADPSVAERLRSPRGRKLNLSSVEAVAYARTLEERQQAFITRMRGATPGAVITRRFKLVVNGLAVRLSGRDLAVLQRLPEIRAITVIREFRPTMNVSLGMIGANVLQKELGGRNAGAGIRIGIVDTGIDIRNPFFNARGYVAPPGFPRVDHAGNQPYVNNKVIVARAYPEAGAADSAADTIGHGSHVAGTSGGNDRTRATVEGVQFTLSGVAPRAYLGNYNVFPDNAASTGDDQIIAAIEDVVADGMDVFNMSLGGMILTPAASDPVVVATNSAADAGVVPAVAAGNSGPGAGTVASPGNAQKAITAGASTNPHFLGQPVSVTGPGTPPSNLTNLGAATGDFNTYESTTEAFFVWWDAVDGSGNGQACEALAGTPLAGKLALIQRGTCPFTTKVRNAENAGAIGALVFNNVAGDPVAMGHDGTEPFPAIPAVMVSKTNGEGMRDWYTANPGTATARVDPTFAEFKTTSADIIAGFSSRGPTTFDFFLKPDVTAPGVNVLSSINSPTGFAFFQGTSMASPHVAGSAALLVQKFPTWSVQQIKSALITTGKRPVFDHVTGTAPTGVMIRGGGRIDLTRARNPRATFDPASLGFGVVPVTPGLVYMKTVTATGVGAGGSWTTSVSGPFRPDGSAASGVSVTVSPASLALAAGGTGSLTVSITVQAGALGQYEGDIVLMGSTTLRLPYWIAVGAP